MIDPKSLVFRDGRPQVRVDEETGCWIWLGTKTRGYGRIRVGKRASVQAHKVMWERVNGPTPLGQVLGHICSRRSCVSPEHVRPIDEETNNAERYCLPRLSSDTRALIREYFEDDRTDRWIAWEVGISVWAVRRYAEQHAFAAQYTLDIDVPF